MEEFPFVENVPFVDMEQMIEVDRAMMFDYKIELIQMMENAGRNLAHLARVRFLDGDPRGKRVVVLAGTGGNGGGALVCARRLHNWGADVQVVVTKSAENFNPIPAHQLDVIQRMGVRVEVSDSAEYPLTPDLIVDGVIGYSLRGNPRGSAGAMIAWANQTSTPILALDAPSGVDTTTGQVFDPAIQATATMTLALPKQGLLSNTVASQIGELYLADISVPPELYAAPALQIAVDTIFAQSDIVRLR
ncbi:MAG: NAD(P)H-hydrate epimerase [Candidatus Promineifilaceae bacterium]